MGATVSISVTNARYTKIGRLVKVDVDITINTNSSGVDAKLSLPFAMADNGYYGSGIAGWSNNPDGAKIHVGGGGFYLMKLDNTSIGNQHMSFAHISGYRFIMGFTYEAT